MSAADSVIWKLVACFGAEERGSRLLGMFQTYADESGRGDPHIFVDAGFLADAKSWADFSLEWEAALYRAPSIRIFKCDEAANCTGAFEGWPTQQRDEKVALLIDVINRHAKFSVACMLNADVYKQSFKGNIGKTMDSPHFHVHCRIIRDTLQWHYEAAPKGKIDFIFDKIQETELYEVREHWERIKARGEFWERRRLGRKPFDENDETVLPLQAADLLAGSYYRWAKDITSGLSESDSLGANWVKMVKIPRGEDLIDNEHTAALAEGMLRTKEQTGASYETGKERSKRLKPHRSSS